MTSRSSPTSTRGGSRRPVTRFKVRDTFGLVLLEAMASGVPVAAYPVSGPEDVVRDGVTGCLDEDLGKAIRHAFHLDRDACRAHALARSWEAATRQFLGHLAINGPAGQEGLAGEIAASR